MLRETVKVARRGQVTLPASLRKAAGIQEGDYLEFQVEGDRITLVVKKLVDKGQAYFWMDAWQQGEREASDDVRSGRVRTFGSVEELIAELRS